MGWVREHTRALNDALGPKRYMLAPVIGAVVGFADWVIDKLTEVGLATLIGLPPWAIGIFAAALLVMWWLLEYAVTLRNRITGARVALSHLRTEGVKIRNAGKDRFPDIESFVKWQKSALNWNDEVIGAIRKVSEADAEWFSVLDIVPTARLDVGATTEVHRKLYNEHDFRLHRLGEMIQTLWE